MKKDPNPVPFPNALFCDCCFGYNYSTFSNNCFLSTGMRQGKGDALVSVKIGSTIFLK